MKNSSLFIGIRNVNEDYFTSPCTALFTNSSCGIFPTISANYPIANYPVASVGIDYKLNLNKWFLETSIYNGTGYRNLSGNRKLLEQSCIKKQITYYFDLFKLYTFVVEFKRPL